MSWRFVFFIPLAVPASYAADEDAESLFVRRIGPLFAEKCLACHGNDAEKIKGGYDLRSRKSALRGGDSERPGFVPGKPLESPLYLATLRDHADWEPMPPKEADKLDPRQISWIRDWIAGGAPWPDPVRANVIAARHASVWEAEDGVTVKTAGGQSAEWTNRKYQADGLWAYRPVTKPVTKHQGAAAIDELIALRAPAGVDPAPPADARTLIRRASFDLTGLPPSPEEVEAFVVDHARDAGRAFAALIDRLLESPHYGEKMAQHWLDVTRYADSGGLANDYERGNAWRYRDYVARSFNADKPYDRFVKEQIAGDELDAGAEGLIATGFLRMGPWELTGMEVAKVARQRFLDDVTNSVGEVFLAHSLQCARCHDHKFDPVPTSDYYAIQAVFSATQLAERPAPFLETENVEHFDERRYLESKRDEHRETLTRLEAVLLENARAWFDENGRDPARWQAALEKSGGNFSAARNALMKEGVPESDFPPKLVGFTPEQFGQERVARKGLERLKWELERYEPYALAVYTGGTPSLKSVYAPMRMPARPMEQGEIERTSILVGGDPFSAGAPAAPGTLSVLSVIPGLDARLPETPQRRRAAFADWVASPRNPLTARAIVNRVWLWHFGEPLAGNPNNFGTTGAKPTHPELLDWLAAAFVGDDWSFKALHRAIMMSETYRRSARPGAVAAERAFLAFRPRRLSAEELRDAMLAVSGELNREIGGIPNRPEINAEAALQPRQVMGTFAAAWVPNPQPAQRHRRSIYALKLRGLADPLLEVFNSPAPDFSCERREASTVTPQAFALFNSQGSHSRALALAARVLGETGNDDATAIGRCFALALGRPPRADEEAACLSHWREMIPTRERAVFPNVKPPLAVRREAVEENTGENFVFEEKLHANADFVPDLQPADCDARTLALADVCLALLNANEFAYVY